MLSSPPEREKLFRQLRKKYKSVFAFHGSSIENWHSIIRNGLMNASGTDKQVNGAAYGSGIYMSPRVCSTAFFFICVICPINSSKPQWVIQDHRESAVSHSARVCAHACLSIHNPYNAYFFTSFCSNRQWDQEGN